MKLAKLSVLTPLFVTAFAQDLSVEGVKQAFDNANVRSSPPPNYSSSIIYG